MSAAVLALATSLAAQCSGPACPDPCTECAFPPVSGTNQTVPELRELFVAIAERGGAADLPTIADVEVGSARAAAPAPFPCRLLPAIAATESSITQFCDASGLTVISFDCGFGIMQVTSGAASYPGLEARADINVAAGANILAQKWNGNESYGGQFDDSDPALVESWYFAVWAYNGFVYGNNPNNPSFPASRPPYHGPASLSRGSYPYQELVWGYLRHPLEKDGVLVVEPLEVSYPDPSTIPDQSGLFSVDVPLPEPTHGDPCAEQCPPSGCPPDELRTLILDDLDAGFTVEGDTDEHASGGYLDHFRSAALAPAGAPTVRARFTGVAPWSGTFDVAAFVPLDPATCTDVRISVDGCGAPVSFSADQNVPGGSFTALGQVVLRQGDPVSIEVGNDSDDTDTNHRVGIDAFRLSWRGEADLTTCESGGEGEGEAPATGDAGPRYVPLGEGCACSTGGHGELVGLAIAALALALATRRRRAHPD
ncbi:MAG: hypothetical protein IT383_14950 [Deltaproteobacteria bacterium]|nr:hypothetical protein [Deltaproteobacteria bacterium]